MAFMHDLYETIIEALFPLSPAETELFSMSPEQALNKLPKAPEYGHSTVPLQNTYSIFAYKDERVSKLIWNIKYKKSEKAIKIGGYALFHELLENQAFAETMANIGEGRTFVIPIPITDQRRRERGYNQCELLLDEIERLSKLSISADHHSPTSSLTFNKEILIKTRNAKRQTLKNREERLDSAKDIFAIDNKALNRLSSDKTSLNVKDYPVIIIDDVITTGSTMKEARDTLKEAGFKKVFGLSLAH